MSSEYVMAIDVGGGGVRCMVLDVSAGTRTCAARALRHPVARDTEGWGYDLDVEGIWLATGRVAREALARSGATPDRVLGVATTSMRFGMVLLDGDGRVIWAVPNRDARAAGQGMDLANERGREFHERTGHWPSPIAAAARLLWLKESAPEALAGARALLSIDEWLAFRLCGRAASEPSQAGETSLFDTATGAWAMDLIGGLGLPRVLFPEVKRAGDRLGELGAEASQALGLKAGTPVVLGGADTQCALLGLDAIEPGQTAVIAGTTVPLQMVADKPIIDPHERLWTGCHVVPGRWVLESNAGAAGEVLDWLGEMFFPGDPTGAARLAAEAAFSSPGAGGLLSSLGVRAFNASQLDLSVETLSLSHLTVSSASNLRHVARSVLEGFAFSVRTNLDQILSVAPSSGRPIAMAGGLSRSRLWSSILSDVTGRPIRTSVTPEASLLGAAICAGTGAGVWPDLATGAKRMAGSDPVIEPDPTSSARYRGLYEHWQRWCAARGEADSLAAETALRGADESATTASIVRSPEAGFRPKILVAAPLDETSLARLRGLGTVEYCTYIERQRVLTGDDLVDALQGVHVLVTEVDIVDAASLERLPDLRMVFSCRSNPVNVDVPACTAFGIPVFNTPGRNRIAVAEMTVAMLLSLVRRIPMADRFVRQPGAEAGDMARMGIAHETYRGSELFGKTVGLIGFGRIGRSVAALLKPFGARLIVHDPVVAPEEILRRGAEPVGMDDLLAQSDIISLHAAVTGESRRLLGAADLARARKGVLIVNSARAALVDEVALEAFLRSGQVGGAALDVWSREPPASDHPLLGLENVVATPHIAGNTREVAAHQGASVADSLERFMRGEAADSLLNPETLAHFRWTGERRKPSAAELEAIARGRGPAISDLEAEEGAEADEPPEVPRGSAPAAVAVAVSDTAPPAEPRGGFLKRILRGRGRAAEVSAAVGREGPAPSASITQPAAAEARVAEARHRMEAILRDFLQRVDSDLSIRDFARGKAVTVRYVIPDVDLSFHMAFENTPRSALGEPAVKPQVSLRMNAEILDAVFTERIGGMKAAMSGQLAFSGNTMKAMSLQRIQKDLCRLYQEARVAVGDPGDLSGLSAPARPGPSQAAAQPAVPARASAQTVIAAPAIIHRIGDERDELIQAVEELYAAGLVTSTGGNVSVRRASKPDELWITPSALPKGTLSPESMVRIDLSGEPLDEDAPPPSSERLMHARIMAARPEIMAVIHSHGTQAFLLGVTGLPFLPICTESAFLGDVARVPFFMPGSDELAEAVVKALGTGRAILLLNHGALVAATSLKRGVDMTRTLERTAEVIVTCAKLGKEPPVLPAEITKQLCELESAVG